MCVCVSCVLAIAEYSLVQSIYGDLNGSYHNHFFDHRLGHLFVNIFCCWVLQFSTGAIIAGCASNFVLLRSLLLFNNTIYLVYIYFKISMCLALSTFIFYIIRSKGFNHFLFFQILPFAFVLLVPFFFFLLIVCQKGIIEWIFQEYPLSMAEITNRFSRLSIHINIVIRIGKKKKMPTILIFYSSILSWLPFFQLRPKFEISFSMKLTRTEKVFSIFCILRASL